MKPTIDVKPRMLTSEHSEALSEALTCIKETAEAATSLYRDITESEKGNVERAAEILVRCKELCDLRTEHADAFQEYKRGFGLSDRRGTYNTPDADAREVVKLVLRFEKQRSMITRYTQALCHVCMVSDQIGDSALLSYIEQEGGVAGCAKTYREYKRDMKPDDDSDETDDDAIEEKLIETVSVPFSGSPSVIVIDEEGFPHVITDDDAVQMLAKFMAQRSGGDRA